MRCLGRLLGFILVFMFIVVFPCSLWTFNSQRIMLNSSTYTDAFKGKDFYQDLLPGVLPALLEDLQNQSDTIPDDAVTLLSIINHLDQRDWNRIAPQIVPLDWVQSTLETNLDAFLAWVDGNAPSLELIFHTDPLARRLSGPQGDEAVTMIVEALPECSDEEQTRFEDYVKGLEGSIFPYCRPLDPEQRANLTEIVDQARLEAAALFPADIDVMADLHAAAQEELGHGPKDAFSDAELDQFRSTVRLWKRLLPLTLMIPLVILSMIVIFAVRSSKLFFRWMGWTLIIGCLFTLAPLFWLPFITPDLNIQADLESGFATGGALIAEVVGNRMIELLIGQFTWPILGQSAILLVVGFVFAVISVLVSDPDAPPDVTPSTYTAVPIYQTPPGTPIPEGAIRLETTPPVNQPIPPDQGSSQKNI